MGITSRRNLAVAGLVAVLAAAAFTSPAAAASRDEARLSVSIEGPLGNPAVGRTVVVTVDDPALTATAVTNEYGKVTFRVPVAAGGSAVAVDVSNASPIGPDVTVYPGVTPRDRIDLEVTTTLLHGGFSQEPRDEEFYDFDAEGDGLDDALWRLERAGLPDVLAVDVDRDGIGVVTDRVGAGDMGLSVLDLDLDGADEVVLRSEDASGVFSGQVWVYDPGTGDESDFVIGDRSGGWLYWSQLDGAGGLDPYWVPDPDHCGVGAVEMVLADGRRYADFPDEASGFPALVDADGDAIADLRCRTFDWDTWEWTVWVWSSASDQVTSVTVPGTSSEPPDILP